MFLNGNIAASVLPSCSSEAAPERLQFITKFYLTLFCFKTHLKSNTKQHFLHIHTKLLVNKRRIS